MRTLGDHSFQKQSPDKSHPKAPKQNNFDNLDSIPVHLYSPTGPPFSCVSVEGLGALSPAPTLKFNTFNPKPNQPSTAW